MEMDEEYIEKVKGLIEQKDAASVKELLTDLHPADIAELCNELDLEEARFVYRLLDNETAADVLVEMDEDMRKELLDALPSETIAKRFVDYMDTDDAVELMRDLDEDKQEEVLSHIGDIEQAGDIVDLLKYDEDTAGGLMGTEMVTVNENWSMPECLKEMRQQAEDLDEIYYVYVIDDEDRLQGVFPLKKMITSPSVSKVKHVMKKDPISVHVDTPIDEVVQTMQLLSSSINIGEMFKNLWEASGLAQGDVLDFRLVTAELFHPLGYDSGANFFITMVRQWGGEYTGIDEETREGYVAFDSDVVKEALAYFKTLHEEDVVAIPADFGETSYCSGPFTELQSVMNIGSTAGTAHSVPAAARFVTDVAPVPYKDAERMYVISQGTNLVLLDKGTEEERAAAWKLLKWLTKWHNGEFCAETGYFPSCEYSEKSAAYQEFLTREPQNYADYVAQSTSLVNSEHYINPEKGWTKFVDTPFVGSSIVRDSVDAIMQMLFFGEGATPESVIQDRYQDIRAAGIETR